MKKITCQVCGIKISEKRISAHIKKHKIQLRPKHKDIGLISGRGEYETLSYGSDEPLIGESYLDLIKINFTETSEYKKSSNLEDDEDYPDALFVYEPSDVNELNIEDIKTIWNKKESLCGSIEAAAEVLALLRVDSGIDENYKGWQHYINNEEILQLGEYIQSLYNENDDKPASIVHRSTIDKSDNNVVVSKSAELFVYEPSDVNELNIEDIKTIWNKKESLCGSIEAAAEVLALLRVDSGIDENYKGWQHYINNEIIIGLKDYMPSLMEKQYTQPSNEEIFNINVNSLKDRRNKLERIIVTRQGQADFRTMVLKKYNNKCCITNCKELSLLDAAHIIPYKGEYTNHSGNALCLRIDFHRLFDKYLITIEPLTFKLIVSSLVTDKYYQQFSNLDLFQFTEKPSQEALNYHYEQYNLKNNS